MKLKYIRIWTWELLQNLVALIVKLLFGKEYLDEYNGVKVWTWKLRGGISLGNYIFVPHQYFYDKSLLEVMLKTKWHREYIEHEYGHCVQSQYLGPLYLFIIGLPSLIWACCFEKYRAKHNVSYYWFYTEAWADKLGGVNREG